MSNDFLNWELAKEKVADLQREAEEARLAKAVAGPDSMVAGATLLVLAVVAALLWLMF